MDTEIQTNRRFLIVAAVAFAGFFAVDSFLFAHEGFLRTLGQATQEGQVLSKVRRAPRQAELADVIFFGSSYVRSGIAGEPFLQSGILPFNFAVSGGGPVYHYFALRRIAPTLRQRTQKPVLVLELKTDPLVRTRGSVWSEYPQFSGIVRSRLEMLQHAAPLWRNFREFGMTSQFLSGILIPSSIYRSHAVPMLGAGGSLDSYFYGMEDFSGYSPLLTRAGPMPNLPTQMLPPVPLTGIYAGKIEFLKSFLTLAASLECQVVLYQSPSVLLGRDREVLEPLVSSLRAEFPNVQVIWSSDYDLDLDDFDEGGHLNIKGSDKMSAYFVRRLGRRHSPEVLEAKLRQAFLQVPIPDVSTWTIDSARATGAGQELSVSAVLSETMVVAQSPEIRVAPDHEWVLEVAMPIESGRLSVGLSWQSGDQGTSGSLEFVSPLEAAFFGESNRMFLRVAPGAEVLTIKILDYDLQNSRKASAGQVRFLRLWSSR